MSTDVRHGEKFSSQPGIEEGYWSALLQEGEYSSIDDLVSSYELDEIDPYDGSRDDTPIDDADLSEAEDEIRQNWVDIRALMERDAILELKVVGYNRGGLLVEWESLRGFVPASQLVHFPSTDSVEIRRNALLDRVGQTLYLRVIELDEAKNRLILSERAAQVASGTRAQLLESLHDGDIVTGFVTNLCDFGAFVDLGGVEGLIHISELSWGRVGHPSDMLQRGQQVKVYVLDIDPDAARIALSIKRLHPDPWVTVADRYEVGQIVVGRITNVVDFGAFACIEDGLEGLIHFSELAEGHFLHPRNVVSEGEEVRARILSIDGRARRLGLSLRLK